MNSSRIKKQQRNKGITTLPIGSFSRLNLNGTSSFWSLRSAYNILTTEKIN